MNPDRNRDFRRFHLQEDLVPHSDNHRAMVPHVVPDPE
tara:strand:- start:589 stop:702 length:114 start_codon:yes stop_codon:yes gene_type:complete